MSTTARCADKRIVYVFNKSISSNLTKLSNSLKKLPLSSLLILLINSTKEINLDLQELQKMNLISSQKLISEIWLDSSTKNIEPLIALFSQENGLTTSPCPQGIGINKRSKTCITSFLLFCQDPVKDRCRLSSTSTNNFNYTNNAMKATPKHGLTSWH